MTNEYGLNVDYFKKKLELVLRDIHSYTPAEMYRELKRLSEATDYQHIMIKEEL